MHLKPFLRHWALFAAAAWLVFACVQVGVVRAQANGSDIARTQIISGKQAVSGDIVSFDPANQTYFLAKRSSDPNLYGIVVARPLLVLHSNTGGVPVVTSGDALVNVTTANGPIHVGDYITSSAIAGKGEKASSSAEFIVGIALQAFGVSANAASSSTATGSIPVLLHIGQRPATTTPVNTLPHVSPLFATSKSNTNSPAFSIVRYILAALIAIGSIFIAFRSFGANINSGIISVGRNPLAKSSIQFMVILNAGLIILVSFAGLGLAYIVAVAPITPLGL